MHSPFRFQLLSITFYSYIVKSISFMHIKDLNKSPCPLSFSFSHLLPLQLHLSRFSSLALTLLLQLPNSCAATFCEGLKEREDRKALIALIFISHIHTYRHTFIYTDRRTKLPEKVALPLTSKLLVGRMDGWLTMELLFWNAVTLEKRRLLQFFLAPPPPTALFHIFKGKGCKTTVILTYFASYFEIIFLKKIYIGLQALLF